MPATFGQRLYNATLVGLSSGIRRSAFFDQVRAQAKSPGVNAELFVRLDFDALLAGGKIRHDTTCE